MRTMLQLIAAAGGLLTIGHPVFAEVLAYPEKGQSAEKQQKDQYECYQWAKQKTGIDPENLAASAPSQTAPPSKGGAVRGAAKGAAAGTIGGAIGGDVGKGAAIGAGVGAVGGAHEKRKEQKEAQSQANTQKQNELASFNDAQSVCLKGRGYSVK